MPTRTDTRPKHNRKKKRRRKSKKLYKRLLIVYASVLGFAAIVTLILMWVSLSNYQKGIDEAKEAEELELSYQQAPQKYFEKYVAALDTNAWVTLWYEYYSEHFDSEDTVRAYVEEHITNGDYTLFKSPDYTKAAPSYLLKSNDTEVASFYLEGSQLNWHVKDIRMYLKGDYACTVEIPNGGEIYCNDVVIDDQYMTATDIYLDVPNYTDKLNDPVKYNEYTINGLLAEPQLDFDSLSEKYATAQDSDGNYYYALKPDSAETYKASARRFINSLLYYYSQGQTNTGANEAAVLGMLAPNSAAADVIKQSYSGVIWRVTYNTQFDISVSDVYVLAQNCYAVDVNYMRTTNLSDNNDDNEGKYRVYFLDLGNGFKIYDFELK